MKKAFWKKALTLLSICFSFNQLSAQSNVCINEIMQSNIDALIANYDFPDSWIELYNPTESEIDLKNWYIGQTADVNSAFKIASTYKIAAHGYKLIYCDKVNSGAHTNFRLDSGKGELYIFNSKKTLVDKLAYEKMPAANIAFGRVEDGGDQWQYEVVPTPGKTNNSIGSSRILPNPEFSRGGGVFTDSITVVVTFPKLTEKLPEDTKLYLTTDGSEPTKKSATQDTFVIGISKSTVLRAKLISDSVLPQRSVTHSYIYHPRKTKLPIISIATDDTFLYDKTFGLFSKDTLPNKSVPNYKLDLRRPVNSEFFDLSNNDNGEEVFNQLGETAFSGGASRGAGQKSMKLYADKRFGAKRFEGKFWEDKPNVKAVKSFIVRNGGNNTYRCRFNDAMLQKIFGTHVPNLDWQAYEPVIAYINGVYKGVFGMRERSENDYVESNYDGLEDVEVVTHAVYSDENSRKKTSFTELYNSYIQADTEYSTLDSLMDVDNFMGVLMVEMFSTNTDYPFNNVSMWKRNEEGAKWRWIVKDIDQIGTTRAETYNMFTYMFAKGDESSTEYKEATSANWKLRCHKIYQKMISYPEFYNVFIDRYSVYLGDFLKPSVSIPLIEKMDSEIHAEIQPTFSIYNSTTLATYNTCVKKLKTYWQKRPTIMYQHMAQFFDLGTVIPMTLATNGQQVKINGIGLTEGDFDGAYFSNRALKLNSGASNWGWKMTVTHKDKTTDTVSFAQTDVEVLLADYLTDEADEITVAFETVRLEKSDFDLKIESLDIDYLALNNKSDSTSPMIKEPVCAYMNIVSENGKPTTKGEVLDAVIDFYDNNGSYMRKNILFEQQGSDANNENKQNFTISFKSNDDDDLDITFGNWVAQDEFYLKAYYNDGLRGTPVVAYKLYDQIMNVDSGPRMTADAFPCMVYVNGSFQGLYAWQLKKHRKNMDLAKDNSSQVWLDGTLSDKNLFKGNVEWTKFEVRNPKDLYNMDGSTYDGDDPQELLDTTSAAFTGKKKQTRCAEAKEHIIALSNYYNELTSLEESGATAEQMRSAIGERFNVDELIKYMLFSLVTNNYDGFSKNWMWFTRDGKIWTVAPYDCDLTFGYNKEDITTLWEAEKGSKKYDYKLDNVDENGPMLWIKKYFWPDLQAEYAQLRESGIISADNISNIAKDWYMRVSEADRNDEVAKYPSVVTDSPERIAEWATKRIELEDEYLLYGTKTYDIIVSDGQWATICLPFSFELTDKAELYSVNGYNAADSTLILTSEVSAEANQPYLIKAKPGTYTVSGQPKYCDSIMRRGLLVGTYDTIKTPTGSYILQSAGNASKFVEMVLTMSPYHAYLLCTDNEKALPNAFFIEPQTVTDGTLLSNSRMKQIINIYDVEGVRLNALKKGINIVEFDDRSVQKIYVK